MASDPFLGELKIYSFNFAPRGWTMCNGQLLPINQNQPLFSLLGTTYGGNGQTNFALPDLRGRVPMHMGSSLTQGQRAGEEFHTLITSEMPQHIHFAMANSTSPNTNTPAGNTWAGNTGFSPYSNNNSSLSAMYAGALSNTGGSQAHENRSPFLVLNICIALVGIFPSRN